MDQYSNLESIVIGQLEGRFQIPDYQRGYRWSRKQVRQLLDDISQSTTRYYLQPIVVVDSDNDDCDYEVIDGQQRLTTIFIVFKALNNLQEQMKENPFNVLSGINTVPNYSLSYATRESASFLENIAAKKLEEACDNVDYLYMYHAFDAVNKWVQKNPDKIAALAKALNERVCVIWYNAGKEVNCWDKFASLNIGKISLTNSELIKALFLRESGTLTPYERNVIVEEWDAIERELQDEKFWAFLTNKKATAYPTKIDLLFDILAKKGKDEQEEYFTFFFYENELIKQNRNQKEVWDDIYLKYQRLRDWYSDKELYHKIGYLVTVNDWGELIEILNKNTELPKDKFLEDLDERIRKTLPVVDKLEDLTYTDNKTEIARLLTLFNVLSTNELTDDQQRYPFYLHKNVGGGWSLEHIHAQRSETLKDVSQWTEWVRLHLQSLHRYWSVVKAESDEAYIQSKKADIEALIEDMEAFMSKPANARTQTWFETINDQFAKHVVALNGEDIGEYKDLLSNMALLGKNDNSMLNNSTFDVKRQLISEEIIETSYVPLCTQRVFQKTYTPADKNQYYFWGADDREAYVQKIKEILTKYGYLKEHEVQPE